MAILHTQSGRVEIFGDVLELSAHRGSRQDDFVFYFSPRRGSCFLHPGLAHLGGLLVLLSFSESGFGTHVMFS